MLVGTGCEDCPMVWQFGDGDRSFGGGRLDLHGLPWLQILLRGLGDKATWLYAYLRSCWLARGPWISSPCHSMVSFSSRRTGIANGRWVSWQCWIHSHAIPLLFWLYSVKAVVMFSWVCVSSFSNIALIFP